MKVFYETNERLGTGTLVFTTKKDMVFSTAKTQPCCHPVVLFFEKGNLFVSSAPQRDYQKHPHYVLFHLSCGTDCLFPETKLCLVGTLAGMALDLMKGLRNGLATLRVAELADKQIVFSLFCRNLQDVCLKSLKHTATLNTFPLSAAVFKKAQSIQCGACHAPLALPGVSQFLDKPSEHWEEFMDMWSCVKGEFAVSGGVSFSPKKNCVVVQREDFLILPTDTQNIVLHEKKLLCECGAAVGSLAGCVFSLYKPAVELVLPDRRMVKCTWREIIASELFYQINTTGFNRFLVSQGENTEKIAVVIVSCGVCFSVGYGQPIPGIKIKYRVLGKQEEEAPQHQELFFSEQKYDALRKTLAHLEKLLPPFYKHSEKISFIPVF
ncbi:MAG: uncharacterized protein A8A55_0983 [Amphiamblys sp. WSBS2006]|nr:MAG: uncharacterized protein A8A55_0983 [Amphiamblys sp. WSBS2006]